MLPIFGYSGLDGVFFLQTKFAKQGLLSFFEKLSMAHSPPQGMKIIRNSWEFTGTHRGSLSSHCSPKFLFAGQLPFRLTLYSICILCCASRNVVCLSSNLKCFRGLLAASQNFGENCQHLGTEVDRKSGLFFCSHYSAEAR